MSPSTKQFVHSTYFEKEVNGQPNNYLVINEKDGTTGQSRLVFRKNIERPIWITKPQFRNHSFKKEYEHIGKLDTYMVKEHEKWDACFEILNGYKPRRKQNKNNSSSPYIYGVDIDAAALIKTEYLDKNNDTYPVIAYGAADIERSMLGGDEIIVFTYVSENWKVCTAIYQPFLEKPDQPGEFYTEEDIRTNTKEKLIEYLALYKQNKDKDTIDLTFDMLDIEYYITDNELDLIKWLFRCIHNDKPDLCGFWNIDYDMPAIVEQIKRRGSSLEDVMCHPEVPEEYRYAEYKEDRTEVDHISLSWHNMFISGYTRFVDSMCLYSRKRTVQGRDISYALQYIAEKEVKIGKLELNGSGYHMYLQKHKFLDYIAYNICDNIPVILMEKKNSDLMTLIGTSDNSSIEHFGFPSIGLTNSFYRFARTKNHVTCAADRLMKTEFDHLIPSTGGLVLDPTLTRNTSVSIIDGYEQLYGFCKMVSDIDAAAIYPTICEICNISKETKCSTCVDIIGNSEYLTNNINTINAIPMDDPDRNKKVLKIKGTVVNNLFLHLIATTENAVKIGSDYFNLPGYEEMLQIYNATMQGET